MAGVDARIILVGLPTIAESLHAGVDELIWITQAYLFAETIGLLLIGRTADLAGRVKIYNYGFVIFTVGSALAALSFNSLELIVSRMVQGLGSSMMITNAAAILTDATPRNELGKILGMNSIAFRVGSVTGLTLSGVILSITSWRALFYINIPIGIFGTVWAHYRLKEVSTRDNYRGMDWIGFLAFSAGLGLVLLAITYLSFGLSGYGFGLSLLAFGIALLLFFVYYELKGKMSTRPLLDMNLFKIKEFAGGSTAMMINAIAWSAIMIMVSFYLQVVVGETPLQTGLSLLALDSTLIFSAPISGRLSDRYGSRAFVVIGLAISSAAFFIIGLFVTSSSDTTTLLLGLALLGVGSGMWVSPNTSSIMGSVPANRRGIASAFRMTMGNIGDTLSFGIAVLLLTLVIPYTALNALIDSYSIPGTSILSRVAFLHGFQLIALVMASVNTIAIIPATFAKKLSPSQKISTVSEEDFRAKSIRGHGKLDG
jgi:EmrB/QacA subfamily drug resistance transporter